MFLFTESTHLSCYCSLLNLSCEAEERHKIIMFAIYIIFHMFTHTKYIEEFEAMGKVRSFMGFLISILLSVLVNVTNESLWCQVRFQFKSCPKLWKPFACEIPPADWPPALGSQHRKHMELLEWVQRRHQVDPRAGTPLPWGKAEGVWFVQPGEEKFWDELTVAFHYLREATRKIETI